MVVIGSVFKVTLQDWTRLLIIPAVLAAGGYWFNRAQSERQQQIENQHAQSSALQEYLDTMKDLLLDKEHPLRSQREESEEVRRVARARTLAVLSWLDGTRQGSVVRFLSESGLIDKKCPIIILGGTRDRDRKSGGERRHIAIAATGLGEHALTLGGVKLEKVDLQGANLRGTDLSHISLNYARLNGADLTDADLSGSFLVGADLIGTDLRDAILDNAVLSWANLYLASITEEEIQQLAARNALVGAMMPDGSRPYPPTWEAQDFLRKHPEDAVAQRKRMLERISSSLRHAQDQALRAYLNRMSELLTDKDRPLRAAPPHDNTREAARAQTLAILPGLDGRHKSSVLLFLRQEGLISAENGPTLSLSGADLRRACLNRAYLQGVNLSETILEGAALEGANLSGVDLSNATLSGANVQHTNLRGADLSNANLRGSYLNSSNLSGSNLRGADLNGADFSDADLSGATGSTDEQLEQQATSLEGATMPNGSKHV